MHRPLIRMLSTPSARRLLVLSFLLLSCGTSGFLTGKVVSVVDGDTLDILSDGKTYTIRLWGIDCPERGQPFGRAAKRFTSARCFGQSVTVEVRGHDQYGRVLGEVILGDGARLSEELLTAGYAWWFDRYVFSEKYRDLEKTARANRKGLWSDSGSVAPWEYRRLENLRITP